MATERTNYEKATDALDQAWEVITDPPGQALDVTGGPQIPWATAALGIGVGYALLALRDEIQAHGLGRD